MHPSISITAPPAFRVGGEDRSCVWPRAVRTRLRFILSVYYAQWKTIHFEPLRIDIETSPVGRRWITINHLLSFSFFLIVFSALCSVKCSPHFAAGSSLAINTSGFSVVRSDVSTACIREKEREDGEREGGRRRRAAAALHVSEEKKNIFFLPSLSPVRVLNEACWQRGPQSCSGSHQDAIWRISCDSD